MLLPKALREFIESLNSHGVEYVIVGAYAVAFHGRPRTTDDIDLLVGTSSENAARVPVYVLGRELLKRNKAATGRDQDRADLRLLND